MGTIAPERSRRRRKPPDAGAAREAASDGHSPATTRQDVGETLLACVHADASLAGSAGKMMACIASDETDPS